MAHKLPSQIMLTCKHSLHANSMSYNDILYTLYSLYLVTSRSKQINYCQNMFVG